MVPENSDLMRHYEEAAARGELEEEYDGLEITLEEARNAGVSFRPTGADDSFKEEYASYVTLRETRVRRCVFVTLRACTYSASQRVILKSQCWSTDRSTRLCLLAYRRDFM